MLSFTDAAVKQFNAVLKGPESVRVAVKGGGCAGMSYALEIDSETSEDDIVVVLENITVYVDPHSASILEATTIDFVKTGLSEGFVFNNPKANTTCGCGSSFY